MSRGPRATPRRGSNARAAVSVAAGVGGALALALGSGARAAASAAAALAAGGARSGDVRRALAALALGLGFALASLEVRREVATWPATRVSRDLALPVAAGLSEAARADLARLPLPSRPSALDPDLVPFTAACLASLPWVLAVDDVRLEPRLGLTFAVRARRPVARLAGGGVVTADGAVLALAYCARPDALPLLAGVDPAAGRRALVLGATVVAELDGLAVAEVDLSNLDGARDPRASEVVLRLQSGLTVDWGRPAGDLPGVQKRAALLTFLERGPPPEGVLRVSVRWDHPVYVLRPAEPLARRDGVTGG